MPEPATPTDRSLAAEPSERHATGAALEQRERELRALVEPIAEELELSSVELNRELDCDSEAVREVSGHARRYRGKRLRAAASLLTAKAFSPTGKLATGRREASGNGAARLPMPQIQIAAIVEMIHMATLVHDDVLDRADLRRRVPTVNSRHGNEVAVLLGDWIYARAFCISTKLADQTCSRVLSEVTATICRGEIEQSKAKYDFGLTEERYLAMIDAKTTALFQAACELGARYALTGRDGANGGVDESLVSAAGRYGRNLGLAFQIVDDCLDLDGSEDVVGKSLGTDVAEGKITLPIILLLRSLSPEGRRRVEEIFRAQRARGADAHHEGVAELARAFPLGDAVRAAYGAAKESVDAALTALESFPRSPARECLAAMAGYVAGRRW